MSLIYNIAWAILKICTSIFFRDITIIGAENIPKKSPVIVCGNHANQFVDAMLMLSTVGRQISFIMAAKSMKRPVIGHFGRALKCIPVERPQDLAKNGIGQITSISKDTVMGSNTNFTKLKPGDMIKVKEISDEMIISKVINDIELKLTATLAREIQNMKSSYKVIPKLDQSKLYESVWNALRDNACIGIFPEGGSHDRTELLPLKAGVTIMALGATGRCKEPITIIPCGFNYFQGHRFRSKVVIEYGKPYIIPNELSDLYNKNKKEAIAQLLQEIEKRMRDVTIQAPSYSELSAIYLARSLYVPDDYKLSEHDLFILHQRLAEGYRKFKDHPEVHKLFSSIKEYYTNIKNLGIQDSQVRKLDLGFISNFSRVLYSFIMMILSSIFALPGILINGPIALIIKFLSEKERRKALASSNVKVKGFDVVASYKVICSIVAFPVASFIWTYGFRVLITYATDLNKEVIYILTVIFFFVWPAYSYAMIRSADGFVRHFRNLKSRFLVFISKDKIITLKEARVNLQEKVRQFVDKYGAEVLSDFEKNRIINQAAYAKESIDLAKAFEILEEIGLQIREYIFVNPIQN